MAPNVSDLMLLIVAAAVSAALIKLHTEDATLKFRLTNHPPASVWTRLFIGHSLTASGLIFGISRLYLLLLFFVLLFFAVFLPIGSLI